MTEKLIHQHRKNEHISLALKYWKNEHPATDALNFNDFRLIPNGLPELSLDDIDLSVDAFGAHFDLPFYIEAMTGGSDLGDKINAQLAQVAANQKIPMAVGSQSIAIKFPELAAGFANVRQLNPNGFIFANLGAHHNLESAKKAVAMLDANALELHINVAQELTMKASEGDRIFYWLDNINEIAAKLEVPVIVKEVGFGMSQDLIKKLNQTAISGINLGGSGGTDFAWIEHQRGGEFELKNYGFSTPESLLEAQFAQNHKTLIATGGIKTPEQILKAQLLGADLVSSAGFILKTLIEQGQEPLEQLLENWQTDLRHLYLLQSAKNQKALKQKTLLQNSKAQNFRQQRKN